ncbi:IS5 family transposase, partial [Marinomonas spartinae]|uniref:IS5 family transposase n=1 Tax=Marinomonas spartinae TaxID=1792290 RepID=UPI00082B0FB6
QLIDIINPNHALVRLAKVLDWDRLDTELGTHFATVGAAALPTRLMVGLLYLQHLYNLSDEMVLEQWLESPYYQYFCGKTFFQHDFPCHSTSLVKWRKRLGEEGCEWLLTQTIQAGLKLKVIKSASLKRVIVDTTVQEKNITFPTDAKLYNKAQQQLNQVAKDLAITLRQTYDKACHELMPKIGRYGHAKQYKRMRKAIKQVKGFLGRVLRDIDRQVKRQGLTLTQKQEDTLNQAYRLLKQTSQSKNKLYSLHEPNVDCISKGKAHKRYEFGVKASIAVTAKESFIVGARSYPGNPYDGHTLKDQLQQVETLTGKKPENCFVDRGYKGSGVEDIKVLVTGQKRGVPKKEKSWMGRRNSVEPIIGHLKSDGKLRRCFLKGVLGDAINVILSACGQNLRKLLKWLYCAPYFGPFL